MRWSQRTGLAVRVALTTIVVAGLGVDAWVHLHLAAQYDGVRSSALSQGDLFRAEGSVAVLAAVALIVRPRWYSAVFALLVAAAGVAAVLVLRYVDVGAFGPFPDMYEPVWYAQKVQSVWGEGVAAAAALVLALFLLPRRHRG